eukprot:scaffold213369_cov36-Tisochrysis_lutea.AAC.1
MKRSHSTDCDPRTSTSESRLTLCKRRRELGHPLLTIAGRWKMGMALGQLPIPKKLILSVLGLEIPIARQHIWNAITSKIGRASCRERGVRPEARHLSRAESKIFERRSASTHGSSGGGPSRHLRQHAIPALQPALHPVRTAVIAALKGPLGSGGNGSRGGGGGHGLVSEARAMSTASETKREVGQARLTPIYPLKGRP